MGQWKGKNAVILGCATGIGKALVDHAVREGMAIALIDIDAAAIDDRARALRADGVDAIAITADMANRSQVERAAQQCFDHFTTIDLVFLNAGIQRQGGFLEVGLDDHLKMVNTNLVGMMVALHSFLQPMVESQHPGRIVATASACSLFVPANLASYNAAKGGVLNLVETIHHELESTRSSVRMSALLPGAVNTKLHDWGRFDNDAQAAVGSIADHESRLRHVLTSYGMDPSHVAQTVFHGIEQDKFWLLPHPEIKNFTQDRMDRFYAEENPRLPPR